MATDDETARKERADKLRAQISRLKNPDKSDTSTCVPEEPQSESSAGKSPRDFINERMRELDKEDK
jgi:hypothetical protein